VDKTVLKCRSDVAVAHRYGRDATNARRDLAEAKIAQYIRQVVEAAPPLTAEQRDRLALLLRGDAA
jgi:hypothetical protein